MVTVTFRHMETTEALKDYAEEKLTRLDKYDTRAVDTHVVLSTEKFEHVAEVTVVVAGASFKGTERSEDMYASIDAAVDKVERQILKHKEKLARR